MASSINRFFHHTKLQFSHHHNLLSTAALLRSPAALRTTAAAGIPNQLDAIILPTNLTALPFPQLQSAHASFLKLGLLYPAISAADNLIQSYLNCGQIDHALKVFDEMPRQSSLSSNSLILSCNANSRYDDSWKTFRRMHGIGSTVDAIAGILSACASEKVLRHGGEQVHGIVTKTGLCSNPYVAAGVINLYTAEEAFEALNDVEFANIFCWNAALSGAVKSGDGITAFRVFNEMCRHDSIAPDAFAISRILAVCAKEIEYGESIHGQAIKRGIEADAFAGTAIVDFYARSGDTRSAVKEFESIPVRNSGAWAAIIRGFIHDGDPGSAIRVLSDMRKAGEEVNKFTVSTVIAACGDPTMFEEVRQLHGWVLKMGLYRDSVVRAPLIKMYSNAGAIDMSELVFAEFRDTEEVGIWANMLSVYVNDGKSYEKAVDFFRRMLEENVAIDHFVASSILSVVDNLSLGRRIHGHIVKTGFLSEVSVSCSIFTMYSKCGDLTESLNAFRRLEKKDVVSWTSMISGLSEHGRANDAVMLFREMVPEYPTIDAKILAAVMNACSVLCSSKLGKEVHGAALRRGFAGEATIDGASVNMYAKCGDLRSATVAFTMMPVKDPISRSSIIAGFSHHGRVDEALKLLKDMLISTPSLDPFTISSVIGAVAISGAPPIGMSLHAHIIKISLESYAAVGSSIVMMYSKNGRIDDCLKAFKQITNPDLVSWTAMIDCFAYHGKGTEALTSFDVMTKSGINPDDETFLAVLSACSHAGLVDAGYRHLNSMIVDYRIQPGHKHYVCMVDLLGRAGRVEEAARFICNMPFEPDMIAWETLLAACRVHGNREIGKLAARKVLELRPPDAGAYVMASNMFAEEGEWEQVEQLRSLMIECRVKKAEPGWSHA
ncbi:pentatricopeptide repeat-containing protein At1g74600, chloroplastic [Andrographis paniculata]|uniref:pentatricopeptide repeat-containing protein At1g74600, chloroplastic n=1 Tax=Andrographis paniculata TaxID=175694 RepID=UPI0021E99809|nr:pentatricopeptide repeat-containing protein At1g74600, chloroplastic [Andrographis paniculata]